MDDDCVFCGIAAGTQPARKVREWPDAVAFLPLNPVTEGHTLVIPRVHVTDAAVDPLITAVVMARAAEQAALCQAANILTSIGTAATQSVMHLHAHVVPRSVGDELMLPWGTTGDPHEPHRCKGMDALADEVRRLTAPVMTGGAPVYVGQLVWATPAPGLRYIPVAVKGPITAMWPLA
jgi:histidine triad (HIT) family protein